MERYRRGPKGPNRQHPSAHDGTNADGSEENSKRDDADETVGYGKPPKHTQFKPGKSGNPKGRPRGLRNFKTDVTAMLKAPVRITRDGKPLKISTQKAMLLRLAEQGLRGDIRALVQYLQLAQTYNNEGVSPSGTLSKDDVAVLEIFKARVLNGTANFGTDEIRRGPDGRPNIPTDLVERPGDQESNKPERARNDQTTKVDPRRRK